MMTRIISNDTLQLNIFKKRNHKHYNIILYTFINYLKDFITILLYTDKKDNFCKIFLKNCCGALSHCCGALIFKGSTKAIFVCSSFRLNSYIMSSKYRSCFTLSRITSVARRVDCFWKGSKPDCLAAV